MKVLPAFIGFVAITTVLIAHGFAAENPLETWRSQSVPSVTNSLGAVAYGNGRWVAVGDGGIVLYSLDSETWQAAPSVTTKDLYSIVFANGLFAVGGSERAILTSTNGIDWKSHSGAGASPNFGAAFGNGRFVLAGGSRIYISEEGDIWEPRLSPFDDTVSGLTFGEVFVGVGYDDNDVGSIFTSTDGVSWTAQTVPPNEGLLGVGFGNGTYVAVGSVGAAAVSTNSTSWTAATTGTINDLWGTEYGHGAFVAVGWGGVILTSPDGSAWTQRSSGTTNALYGIGYGNRQFVAVGRNGTILVSDPFPEMEAPSLSEPAKRPGEFSFRLSGTPGQTYSIQFTSNLKEWTTLTNVLCTVSPMSYAIPENASREGYYRLAAN
jgi:hypothetical protein